MYCGHEAEFKPKAFVVGGLPKVYSRVYCGDNRLRFASAKAFFAKVWHHNQKPAGITQSKKMSASSVANNTVEDMFEFESQTHDSFLATKLAVLRDDGRFCDVTLIAEVFTAVLQWVEFDLSSRKQFLPKLLEHVRFPLCQPEFLVNSVSTNALLMEDATCRTLVDRAKNDLILRSSAFECPRIRGRRIREDAGVIYVVGGKAESSVERLDSDGANPAWQYVAPLNQGRIVTGCSVAVVDKFIYAVGGDGCLGIFNSIERYNPATDEWMSDVAPCPTRPFFLGLAALDDHLYAIGGFKDHRDRNHCIVDRYDFRRNEWTFMAPMGLCRSLHSVSVLDGCLYAVGGCENAIALNSVERIDPRVGIWEEVCPMSTRRWGHGSAVLHGELYVAGGHNGNSGELGSAEKYDLRANKWTSVADMSCSRVGLGLAAVNEKLYAIGGLNRSVDRSLVDHASVEVFDPKTNQWKHHSNMNCRRTNPGVAILQKL
nr:BTB Kelch-associated and Kelch repeat type 1 domain containing protein [Haemonchus contortus]